MRFGIGHNYIGYPHEVDWPAIKALADKHGLSAIVLDGVNEVRKYNDNANVLLGSEGDTACDQRGANFDLSIPQAVLLQWIGEVMQNYEQRFVQYKNAIASLAGWYNQHGYRMMVLKGYGCSLNWPRLEHRPCGDIDIWLFGKQKDADAVLAKEKGVKIDTSHHHHTVFEWQGFTVENHYDFLNVHHHKSNVELERMLKELGQDDSHSVEVMGDASTGSAAKVYLPSPNLHALFLLRHSLSNFASTGLKLRQLLDWAFLVEKHRKDIDWEWLENTLERFGMKKTYEIFNAICVDDLGFDLHIFPEVQFDPFMKDRVFNDILRPEFSENEKGGLLSRIVFKYRRWKANEWKHELCFTESMRSAFWSGVWNHLLKPSSI